MAQFCALKVLQRQSPLIKEMAASHAMPQSETPQTLCHPSHYFHAVYGLLILAILK